MTLSAEQQAQLGVLVAAQARSYSQIEDGLVERLLRLLEPLLGLGWFDNRLVLRMRTQAIEQVRDAQEAVADLTEGYLDAVFDVMDVPVPPARRRRGVNLPPQLRTVDPATEWERPARDARVARLIGLDEFEADQKARQRAERQARMDVALAAREAEKQRWGVSDEITGYRRIIRPELSKYGVCGLCVVAASRTYGKGDLKPLHNGCNCTVLPITRSEDPGFDLNREDLDAYYEAAGGTGRSGLQRVVVRNLEHGELGPILVDNRYKNRTAEETEKLAEAALDPERVFKVQDDLVRKYEQMIADGKDVNPKTLDFHRRTRDEWSSRREAA